MNSDRMSRKKKSQLRLIINPEASVGRARKYIPQIKKILGERFFLDTTLTPKAGSATSIAIDTFDECEAVVACGGDGTLNEVVNGLALRKRPLPLGFIPLGTSNLFAQSVGIPRDPLEACKVIISGRRKWIDLGKLSYPSGVRYFVSHAGIGYDAELLFSLNKQWRKMMGVVNAHILQGFHLFFKYSTSKICIETDGKRNYCYNAVVANGEAYGIASIVVPGADLSDGYLDVCLFKKPGKSDLVRYIFGVAWNFHGKFKDVEFIRAKNLKITSEAKVRVQCDGEPVAQLPLEIEVCPKKIEIILP